jgi:hypothetical protein
VNGLLTPNELTAFFSGILRPGEDEEDEPEEKPSLSVDSHTLR